MKENIRFVFVTRDGQVHPINVSGVCTIFDAVAELQSSIMNGDMKIYPQDIIKIIDTPG